MDHKHHNPDRMNAALKLLLSALPSSTRIAIEVASQNKQGLIHIDQDLPLNLFEAQGGGWWRLKPLIAECLTPPQKALESDIYDLIHSQHYERAIKLFTKLGGDLLIYQIGTTRTQRLLNAFPKSLVAKVDILKVTELILAYKTGHSIRGEYLLRKYFGIEHFLIEELLADKKKWRLSERQAFLNIAIYRGSSFSEKTRQLISEMLGEAVIDNHFMRGRTYNCLLVEAMQTDRIELARSYAHRAAHHYHEAKAPYLEFFVQFHLCTIFILYGEPAIAKGHLRKAQNLLAQTEFETPSELRMLMLLDATIAFEDGSIEAMNKFMQNDFQNLTQGESWPQLSTISMTYASRAAFENSGFRKAQELLTYFRINEWRSLRYDANLNRLEADLMQSSGRWMLARDILRTLQTRVHFNWVESASESDMLGLRDSMEIDVSLSWLRDECWHHPTRKSLMERLKGLSANPYVSPSQRLQSNIMLAFIRRKTGDAVSAKRLLLSTLEKRGSLLTLLNMRMFIDELMRKSDIRYDVERSLSAKETLDRLAAITKRSAQNFLPQLTVQENRVLECVAEGASNKEAARLLDLSVATIKFHMTNIMQKLNVSSRREAAHLYNQRAKTPKT